MPQRVILDTHNFIWFIEDNSRLGDTARSVISDPDCEPCLSLASAWEMTIKSAQGKLDLGQPLAILIPAQLLKNSFTLLPITLPHLAILESLPFHHRDPFDRIIIAQSICEGIPLLSVDSKFEPYTHVGLKLIR